MALFDCTEILINKFLEKLREGYEHNHGGNNGHYADIIVWAGRSLMGIIANTDALYHNVEHTIQVTLVGQEILRGKHVAEGGVTCDDWLNFMISLMAHDIGYVKGICRKDDVQKRIFATDTKGGNVQLLPGKTDASLTPYHVGRGQTFIDERFGNHTIIKAETIKNNIENTRFPVPEDDAESGNTDYPNLLRAADLIGQLSDPHYLNKITALFYEFEEVGINAKLGYKNPGDLRDNYPAFYWKHAHPFIKDTLKYLELTPAGRDIVANLFSNIFYVQYRNDIGEKTAA